MQPVADLAEMTRVWAAEHYVGHWDGYSVAAGADDPNNYYLHSDLAGRFSLITSGTDQTWLERPAFGVYGNGVLMRGCVADVTCRQLYVDALAPDRRQPGNRRAPGAGARDSRRNRPLARARSPARADGRRRRGAGRCQDRDAWTPARRSWPTWLASPSFVEAVQPSVPGSGDGSVERRPRAAATDAAVTPPVTAADAVDAATQVRPLLGKPVGAREAGRGEAVHVLTSGDAERHGRAAADRQVGLRPVVAGKTIAHAESFKAGKARLSFVVPKTAKGKLLKVKIAITASGQTAGRTYTYAVR